MHFVPEGDQINYHPLSLPAESRVDYDQCTSAMIVTFLWVVSFFSLVGVVVALPTSYKDHHHSDAAAAALSVE